MIIRLITRIGIFAFTFFFLIQTASAQTDQDLMQRARSMGISQSQIDAALSGRQSQSQSQYPTGMNLDNYRQFNARDTSSRKNFTREDLDEINPVLLEKIILEKLEAEGEMIDVRGRNMLNQSSKKNAALADDDRNNELDYYKQQIKDYEIVIKDGKYIKRPLPVVFGREIFTNRKLSFEPNYNMATPPSYVLGSGDEVSVEVWGTAELHERQKLSPDGNISIKGIGPINLNGLTVEQAQKRIKSKVNQVMADAEVLLSLSQIRLIQVSISGEVLVPGTYSLPSLATVFNAIYSAGGVNDIGSLRSIKVYRHSKEVADLDVYDYLISGKYETNIRLEDNDMIIVSPYQNFVTIHGKVKRERTYEMRKGESLYDLVEFAGGFRGDAYNENIQIKRKTGRQYQIYSVDKRDYDTFPMNDGDSVFVDKVIAEYANRLIIRGAVWRPGEYEFSENTATLSALIEKAEGLKGSEFGSRGQIVRRKKDYTYEMIPFSPVGVVSGREDVALMAEDSIYIPSIMELREDFKVMIGGEVNRPDTIRYRDNMTVEDLILIGGGLKESASLAKIEVARRIKDPNSTSYTNRIAEVFTFNISKDLDVAPEANRFVLQPFDQVYVRRSPGYSEQKSVTILGEVLFEGTYVLATAGERISDLIGKAGGFTPEAYVRGASIKRKMTDDEIAKVESLLRITSTSTGRDSLSLAALNTSSSYPIGVDVSLAMANPGGSDNIILRDGDVIFVPKLSSTVKISGAVLYPNSVAFDGGRVKNYLSQAGGYRDQARKRPFVIYMNGKVAATRSGFLTKHYPKIEPGCEVIVPMKQQRDKSGMAATMGILSSTTSMAAMLATMLNTFK